MTTSLQRKSHVGNITVVVKQIYVSKQAQQSQGGEYTGEGSISFKARTTESTCVVLIVLFLLNKTTWVVLIVLFLLILVEYCNNKR